MGDKRLKLHNTLTRQKEDFQPIDPDNVCVYVCGPTVYDFAHIGNARPAIVFDVLYRLLRHHYGEDQVTYVRNITDVDDKINARAVRDHPDMPLNEAIALVTAKTSGQYQADVKALGCLEPSIEPRATDNIPQMQVMIATLIEKGHAYEAGGEVLFDVTSSRQYGELSRRKMEDQQAGARVAVEDHKKNPADFVLWKQSTDNEPGWPSPWGTGRPGWHIECSAMSERYLGEVFDIHGGGLDLIFPHHENEIAQSRCVHGTSRMANVWMHNGYLQVEGQKMSKSLGNFVTIHELLDSEKFGGRSWPGEVLRLAMLMTHYREPINFSKRKLEEAENLLSKFARRAGDAPDTGAPDAETVALLSDDLNFSAALARLSALEGAGLAATLKLIGFSDYRRAKTADVDEAMIADRIATRLDFIRQKDWASADAIREELASSGIQLKDGKDPQTGDRTTTWELI
ncbi:MAG: cysteine--tRNA ligase [Hyphomicrobiales bacterium]|nr:cysteine--tRNA ligase [Hyphomicrobiales bacterium]MCP5000692.1 cysteine--tRNA ligase [Hyphomicrobiales bacterium]